jgi:hypothetical protein
MDYIIGFIASIIKTAGVYILLGLVVTVIWGIYSVVKWIAGRAAGSAKVVVKISRNGVSSNFAEDTLDTWAEDTGRKIGSKGSEEAGQSLGGAFGRTSSRAADVVVDSLEAGDLF